MTPARKRHTCLQFSSLFALAIALTFGLAGCKSNAPTTAPIVDDGSPDPASANLAPVQPSQQQPYATQPARGQRTRVLDVNSRYSPQQQGEDYGDPNYDSGQPYYQATQPPPPLPVYAQPPAPGEGYIWTPGYWAHSPTGYYWVPGAWKAPPYQGALYTPGYWRNNGRNYVFHPGYWGPHVGYYGGIDNGAGYVGTGYQGGYWSNGRFFYNSVVNNLLPGVASIYRRPVVYQNVRYGPNVVRTVSYNGPGGVVYDPRPYELAAMRERHTPFVYAERENIVVERGRPERIIVNRGHPEGFIPGGAGRGGEGHGRELDHGRGQDHDRGKRHGDGEGHDGEGHGKH